MLPPFYPRKACTHQNSTALPQGINVTALREIKLLQELRSPHLVQLLDVFAHKRKNLQLVRARRAAALSKQRHAPLDALVGSRVCSRRRCKRRGST